MTTRAIVILGAALSQQPLIARAQQRGLAVCAIDGRADRPGLRDADIGIHHDFADTPGVVDALAEHGVDAVGVCSMGSDHAVVPLARLAAALDLPGLSVDAAEAATDKRRQREIGRAHV